MSATHAGASPSAAARAHLAPDRADRASKSRSSNPGTPGPPTERRSSLVMRMRIARFAALRAPKSGGRSLARDEEDQPIGDVDGLVAETPVETREECGVDRGPDVAVPFGALEQGEQSRVHRIEFGLDGVRALDRLEVEV